MSPYAARASNTVHRLPVRRRRHRLLAQQTSPSLSQVYALALAPQLVPTLYTHSEVSPKVLGGADLFLQGVIPPPGGLDAFLAGSIRSVSGPGNPLPFAIGTMAVSKAEADREGMKGRGLALLHAFGDLLWELGDKAPPNAGFTPTRIFPITDGTSSIEAAEAAQYSDALELPQEAEDLPAPTEELAGLSVGGAAAAAAAAAAPAIDMDALLEAAALGGMQSVKTAELPLMASDFYTRHMQPLKPPGITFDFKHSRFKKLSKLLDKLEKDKVLTQKQIRKQDHIFAIDRTHPLVAEWSGMPGGVGGAGGANGSSRGRRTALELLFRAPSSLRPIFGAAGADKDRLYSEPEVAAALEAYAAGNGLLDATKRSIAIDALLASLLWGKKESPGEGAAVALPEVRRRLLEKLQAYHRISRGGDPPVEVVRKGVVRQICISAEKRLGRNVTAVSRVEGFGFVPTDLAGVFQRRLYTSCSVTKLPGKTESDCELLLQGELTKKVVAFFTQDEGIEEKYLDVVNKLKK